MRIEEPSQSEQSTPLVSVIVPVYRVEERYLTRCVKSIEAQTYPNLELLLVDDGSPDNAGVFCDSFAKTYSNIRVLHKENGGVSSARNAGIDASRGEYIGFVDADDFVSPDFYERMVEFAVKNQLPIAASGYQKVTDEKKVCSQLYSEACIMDRCRALEETCRRQTLDVSVCDKIFHRNILSQTDRKIRFQRGITVGEDMLFTWQAFLAADRVGFVPVYGYFYYMREGSAMHTPHPERMSTIFQAIDIMRNGEMPTERLRRMVDDFYIKELASSCISMMLYGNSSYDSRVRQYQKVIRSHGWSCVCREYYPLRVRACILFFFMPHALCRLALKLASRWIRRRYER